MTVPTAPSNHHLIEYDVLQRRLWILGQRCHHGATGVLVTAAACVGLLTERELNPAAAALAAGSLLMAHDWKDRSIWFERGRGSQPARIAGRDQLLPGAPAEAYTPFNASR